MPGSRTYRAITLDLDDTLWPVGPTLVEAEATLGEWMREHAPRTGALLSPDTRAAIRKEVMVEHPQHAHDLGFLRRETLRRAMMLAGEDPTLAEAAYAIFLQARQRVTFFEDVLPVLQRWSTRYRLIAISNGNADLARVGLSPYFLAAVSAHEMGFAKPDPRMFHEACRLADVAPNEVLHLGDDPHLDVIAARKAGLQAAWIRRPMLAHRHPADACGPDAPFEDLYAIDTLLKHPD
jgi:putative hydrolase of the HAD superfamily